MQFLEGSRVYLRSLNIDDDFETYYEMVNDIENVDSIKSLGISHLSKNNLADYVKNYDGQLLGVFDKKDVHVGNVGLSGFDDILRSCSFAILMANKEKGKGYGFEASKILLRHAFLNLNLHRVYLVVVEWNKPAIKMYEKLGFQRDGELRDAFWARGSYHKLLYYSVLRNEFGHL